MPNIRQWINKLYFKPKIAFKMTPLSVYVDLLITDTKFSFSRFGDGEWSSILGKEGANCDGHHYFPQLADQLRNAVVNPCPYMYGMQNFAIKNMGRQIYAFIKKHRVMLSWHNSDVFHYANIAGELNPLIRALRKHNVVIIGPHYLRTAFSQLFTVKHFIEIPSKNCFTAIDSIIQEIRTFGKNKSGIVYAFSASMAANCMIHELYPEIGSNNWLIDFGSLWDIYAGVASRSVYKRAGWDEIIRKNCVS
jgi:hypothetical protein